MHGLFNEAVPNSQRRFRWEYDVMVSRWGSGNGGCGLFDCTGALFVWTDGGKPRKHSGYFI